MFCLQLTELLAFGDVGVGCGTRLLAHLHKRNEKAKIDYWYVHQITVALALTKCSWNQPDLGRATAAGPGSPASRRTQTRSSSREAMLLMAALLCAHCHQGICNYANS